MVSKIRIISSASRESFVKHLRECGTDHPALEDMMWYEDRIGQEYDVKKVGNTVYHLSEASLTEPVKYPTVDKTDAEIIE